MTPEALAAIAARNAAPWEIEKWLITIKAHCTVIADSGGEAKECADRIKQNIDDELRPALLAEVAHLTAALAEAKSVNSEFSWEYAAQIAERFGVNESDRRKFGNEMAEVFRAMVKS